MYVRVDEILIALAYCSKQMHSEELRTLANTEAVTLITDQSDFLHFIFYVRQLSGILRGDGHTHFAHGMCRVIEKWYEKYSPVELVRNNCFVAKNEDNNECRTNEKFLKRVF